VYAKRKTRAAPIKTIIISQIVRINLLKTIPIGIIMPKLIIIRIGAGI
jgi:hypothetical protein